MIQDNVHLNPSLVGSDNTNGSPTNVPKSDSQSRPSISLCSQTEMNSREDSTRQNVLEHSRNDKSTKLEIGARQESEDTSTADRPEIGSTLSEATLRPINVPRESGNLLSMPLSLLGTSSSGKLLGVSPLGNPSGTSPSGRSLGSSPSSRSVLNAEGNASLLNKPTLSLSGYDKEKKTETALPLSGSLSSIASDFGRLKIKSKSDESKYLDLISSGLPSLSSLANKHLSVSHKDRLIQKGEKMNVGDFDLCSSTGPSLASLASDHFTSSEQQLSNGSQKPLNTQDLNLLNLGTLSVSNRGSENVNNSSLGSLKVTGLSHSTSKSPSLLTHSGNKNAGDIGANSSESFPTLASLGDGYFASKRVTMGAPVSFAPSSANLSDKHASFKSLSDIVKPAAGLGMKDSTPITLSLSSMSDKNVDSNSSTDRRHKELELNFSESVTPSLASLATQRLASNSLDDCTSQLSSLSLTAALKTKAKPELQDPKPKSQVKGDISPTLNTPKEPKSQLQPAVRRKPITNKPTWFSKVITATYVSPAKRLSLLSWKDAEVDNFSLPVTVHLFSSDLSRNDDTVFNFTTPSPDDIVKSKQAKAFTRSGK